jgi:tetratricopeptide (TPR) repeat protein
MTPFKHVGFAPYATDSWSDTWFPVKHTRGITNASLLGALNLRVQDGWLKIDWMALTNLSDTLKVSLQGQTLLEKKITLHPMELFRDSLLWNGNAGELSATLGSEVLTAEPGGTLSRPLESPANFDWNSEYGLLLQGTDLSMQKNYAEAEGYLVKAIEKNPCLVPALARMAQIKYRQGLYSEARDFAGKGLTVDTYDAASNYFWGLASEKTGKTSDAFDGYSVATLSPEYRHAAWLRLSYLNIKRSNWKEAGYLIDKCLGSYPPDENSQVVKALIERKKGNTKEAMRIIEELFQSDPLNHRARFEKFMITGSTADRDEFVHMIRQELPHETFIEMALQYTELNLDREAALILRMAPVHPMVELLEARLAEKRGDKLIADNKLTLSMAASPELVFPFRPEMAEMFRWADSVKPDWKWKYYEGLILWQGNRLREARKLFDACGDEPDFMPFWLARAELFREDTATVEKALLKGYSLDHISWRPGLKLAQFYAHTGRADKAFDIASKNYKTHPGSFIVGLQYAQMLKLNRKYSETLKVLSGLEMLPAEGDVNAHSLFREASILYALDLMKAGKYKGALASLQSAETWPENLFSGEPYLADNRITKFLSAYCHDRMKMKQAAEEDLAWITSYRNPDGWTSACGNKLTSLVSSGIKDYRKLAERLAGDNNSDRDSEIIRSFLDQL